MTWWNAFKSTRHSYVSVFAGCIAGTDRGPIPFVRDAVEACNRAVGMEVIWANSRELLNIFISRVMPDIVKKLSGAGKARRVRAGDGEDVIQ